MTGIVPDSIEPVQGWKALDYNPATRRLSSPQTGTRWDPDKRMVATCPYGQFGDLYIAATSASLGFPEHHSPNRMCGCGIHIAAHQSLALHYLNKPTVIRFPVLAKVHGWGRTVPAEKGWRTEFAYPAEIIALGGTRADHQMLANIYNIPVKRSGVKRMWLKQVLRNLWRRPTRMRGMMVMMGMFTAYNIVMTVIFGGWVYPISGTITGLMFLLAILFEALIALHD